MKCHNFILLYVACLDSVEEDAVPRASALIFSPKTSQRLYLSGYFQTEPLTVSAETETDATWTEEILFMKVTNSQSRRSRGSIGHT